MTEERTIEQRVDSLEKQVGIVATKVDMLVAESQQQREDIRRAQEKHDADMKELRQKQDAAQAKHDAEMHEMNARFYEKFDSLSKQINDTWRQTMLGVGGMIVAVGALLFAALK